MQSSVQRFHCSKLAVDAQQHSFLSNNMLPEVYDQPRPTYRTHWCGDVATGEAREKIVIGDNCACNLDLIITCFSKRLCYSDNEAVDWNVLGFDWNHLKF